MNELPENSDSKALRLPTILHGLLKGVAFGPLETQRPWERRGPAGTFREERLPAGRRRSQAYCQEAFIAR
jgi:hypothetical protein